MLAPEQLAERPGCRSCGLAAGSEELAPSAAVSVQLRGLAVATADVLLGEAGSPSPKGWSHFGGLPTQLGLPDRCGRWCLLWGDATPIGGSPPGVAWQELLGRGSGGQTEWCYAS